MIKAIIFDCFGVLTTEGFAAFRDDHFADSSSKRAEANQAMNQLNRGQLEYKEFIGRLSALANVPTGKISRYLDTNQPNRALFNYIRTQLKPKYKIGLLSNAGDDWLEELFSSEDLALFDDIVLSYRHGVIKPARQIFELAAERLGVDAQACILVDDSPRHCDGARAAGMQAVQYQDFTQFKQDLAPLISHKV